MYPQSKSRATAGSITAACLLQNELRVSGYRYNLSANQDIPVFETVGYWLKITFPSQLVGQTIDAKLASIDSRGWFADVQRQYDFTEEWFEGSWSTIPVDEFVISTPL